MKVDIDKISIESLKEILKSKQEEKEKNHKLLRNNYEYLNSDGEWDSFDLFFEIYLKKVEEIMGDEESSDPYFGDLRLFKCTANDGSIYICRLMEE